MSVLAENSLRCVVLNFLQPVHLITVDVNEQGVAVVQPTENKRTHQLSSGFHHQEIAHCPVSAYITSHPSPNRTDTLLNVNNQWRSDGAEDWWSWVSSADLWWPHLLWEITSDSGWMYRVKSIGPKTEPWGTLYCDAHSKQTESYHTNRWSTNGCKADAAPPSQAVWREKLQFWHRSVDFFKLFAKDWTWGQCCCFFVFLEGCHDCLFDLQRNRHKQQWFIYNSATQRHQVI